MELTVEPGNMKTLLLLFLFVPCILGQTWTPNSQYQLAFNPPHLDDIMTQQTHIIHITSCFNMTSQVMAPECFIRVALLDSVNTECSFPAQTLSLSPDLGTQTSSNHPNCTKWPLGAGFHGNLSLSCSHLGHAKLQMQLCLQNGSHTDCDTTSTEYSVSVVREQEVVDTVCYILIAIFLVINNFLFGCSVEFDVVKETLKHPLAPCIGMAFQLALLCPIAYAYTYVFSLPASIAFGLVAHAASPGGGQSNTWTLLLGGDLTLSIFMSLCSTTLSLATTSLWLLTLATTLLPASIVIPVTQILLSLSLLLVPLAIGLLLRHYKPKAGQQASRAAQPTAIFYTILLLTLGIYTYRYAFTILFSNWQTVVAGLVFPYTIMLLAGLVAGICRESWPRVLTVAIEVGIQNGSVTLIVLSSTLGQPEADLASVVPIACILLTPVPLFVGVMVRFIHEGYKKLKSQGEEGGEKEGDVMKKKDGLDMAAESNNRKGNNDDAKVNPSQA